MDLNKKTELKKLGYKVVPTCGLCKHGRFMPTALGFGTCAIQTYQHLKHTDSTRQLSVHRSGICSKFEANPEMIAGLGTFIEFMDRNV